MKDDNVKIKLDYPLVLQVSWLLLCVMGKVKLEELLIVPPFAGTQQSQHCTICIQCYTVQPSGGFILHMIGS